MDTIHLLGSTMGLGFTAGVRLYATVLMLGLGLRLGWFQLPAELERHAAILTNPGVLTAAAVAYVVEFFADKVPWVDSVWDAFHTFVRPLGAVVLAAAALAPADPALRLTVVLLCGGIAFTSHSSKAATRLAVNHSPEPFSNIGLSLLEDLLVPFGVWLSLKYPVLVLAVVCAFLLMFAWISPKVFRLIRLQLAALRSWIAKRPAGKAPNSRFDTFQVRPEAANAISILGKNAIALPENHARALRTQANMRGTLWGIRCAATGRIRGFRNSIGYLTVSGGEMLFVARRSFKYRVQRTKLADVQAAELRRGLLMNRLVIRTSAEEIAFYLFKDLGMGESDDTASRECKAEGVKPLV